MPVGIQVTFVIFGAKRSSPGEGAICLEIKSQQESFRRPALPKLQNRKGIPEPSETLRLKSSTCSASSCVGGTKDPHPWLSRM